MRPLAAALLLLASLAPAAAAAEPSALARTLGTPAEVALTGDGVLISDDLVQARVRSVRPGGAVRTLFERESEALLLSRGLAASEGLAAFSFGPPVFAGAPAGPFARVPDARALALDVTGSTLVTVDPGRRLIARDLGPFGGPAGQFAAGRRLLPIVRAAGDYIAYAERAGGRDVAVVLDRRTAGETSRVVLSGALEALDVQADGKLVLATTRARDETSISWTAPGRAGVRLVARGARGGDVRIAGDRIAFVRSVGIARELAVSDLDGFAAPASFPVASVEAFDFDGPRLAFATSRCLYLERVPGLTVRAAPPAGGPCARTDPRLDAPSRVALSPRRAVLRSRVACPMATSAGCPVALTLALWRGSSFVRLARVRARVRRGGVRTVALRLSAGDLRALRHRDPGPITLEMRPSRVQVPIHVVSPARSRVRARDDGPGGEFVIG